LFIPDFLNRAGGWFLESGIQEPEGGVARYRRTDTGRNLAVSNEITGYALSTLAYLHTLTGEPVYLERALSAARFLTRCAWDARLETFPFEYVAPGNGFTYFFDSGIIVRGLLAVWRITGEPELRDIALACGRSMARDFASGGCFMPILRLPEKRAVECDHRWSRGPGCYQLKSAMAWLDLNEFVADGSLGDAHRTLLDYALRTHEEFLPGDPDQSRVMDRLHAYSYFLEGLLPLANEPRCAESLSGGIVRLAGYLRRIAPVFERSDVYAQLLRVRLFADAAGVAPLDRNAASYEAERLAEFQSAGPEPTVAGGFWFGRKGGEILPFINPVSTGFGLQALAMWENYLAGGAPPPRHALI
jgi:hypothetical protein